MIHLLTPVFTPFVITIFKKRDSDINLNLSQKLIQTTEIKVAFNNCARVHFDKGSIPSVTPRIASNFGK